MSKRTENAPLRVDFKCKLSQRGKISTSNHKKGKDLSVIGETETMTNNDKLNWRYIRSGNNALNDFPTISEVTLEKVPPSIISFKIKKAI